MSSAKPMSSISSASSSTTTARRVELQRSAREVVERPARRRDDDVDALLEGPQLAADRLAAVDRQHPRPEPAAVAVDRLGHLHRQLARGHQDQRARHRRARPSPRDPLQQRQGERGGLAGAGRRLAEQVPALEERRDGLRLDRRRLLVAEHGELGQQLRGRARGRRSWSCRLPGSWPSSFTRVRGAWQCRTRTAAASPSLPTWAGRGLRPRDRRVRRGLRRLQRGRPRLAGGGRGRGPHHRDDRGLRPVRTRRGHGFAGAGIVETPVPS